MLDEDLPEELVETLREALGQEVVGDTVADAVAARLMALAFDGDKKVCLNAIAQMVAVEPKQVEHTFEGEVPELDATPKHLESVKDVLREAQPPTETLQ